MGGGCAGYPHMGALPCALPAGVYPALSGCQDGCSARKVRIRMLMYMHGCMEDGRWGMHRSFTTLMIMAGTISDVSPSDRTYIAVQRMYSATTALHR